MNHHDFGMGIQPVAVARRVNVQIAEAPPERYVLFDGHFLIAEENHLVFEQGPFHGGEVGIRNLSGQVDARNFGADGRRDRLDLERIFHLNRLIPGLPKLGRDHIPVRPQSAIVSN